jgi:glycosyltransferase involved in cell wall biosynthesis
MKKLTDKPIHIVYPGTEVAGRIPSKRDDYLLAVARWEPGKNPLFLLEVLTDLKRKSIQTKLLLVGMWKSDLFREYFTREAKSRGVEDRIAMVGAVSRSELTSLYLRARALIVPDITAFGMIALEAAAHGAPVVIPRGSGVTDLFEDGVHGFFPDENDLEEFSSCIGKLVDDERLAWKMGYRGWEAAQPYTWANHAKNLLSALDITNHR